MFKPFIRSAAMVSLAMLASGQASAAPFGTLTFNTPFAVVSPTDSIDVWVTFTLDAASPNLLLENGGEDTNGTLDPSDIPSHWLSYTRSYLNTYYGHSGDTFSTFSNPAHAYDFDFHTVQPDSLNFIDVYNLAAGASVSYKFGTFNPVGGVAPAGTYQFFDTGLTLNLEGTEEGQLTDFNGDPVFYAAGDYLLDLNGDTVLDENGDPVMAIEGDPVLAAIRAEFSITMANTGAAGVYFVREVTAVPEPETYAMLLAGLGLVGFAARRRLH